MADQITEMKKFEIVNKIMQRYKNLMHDVNKAEQMGIRIDIEIHTDRFANGKRLHHMKIDCLDTHLMQKVKSEKED